MPNQKTISKEFTLSGIGIHSGAPGTIRCIPAPVNTGIRFFRTDLSIEIPATHQFGALAHRATQLKNKGATISTPEHLLSALHSLGITNILINLDSSELPILDGSAIPYIEAIRSAGITDQKIPFPELTIQTPKLVQNEDKWLIALPSPTPKYTYILDLGNHWIHPQILTFTPSIDNYATDIAPARTWGFVQELEFLRNSGLALGADTTNTLAIGEAHYLNKPRFPDELVRHKLLDLIGDLALVPAIINAHIIGFKSGHDLNLKLATKLAKHSSK